MESTSINTTDNTKNTVIQGDTTGSTKTDSISLDRQCIKHRSIMSKYAGSIEFSDRELAMMLEYLQEDK